MSAFEGWEVHPVSYTDAMSIIVKNHYLHRKAPASYCFGLFDNWGSLLGVVTYGTPASPSLCKGIAGEDEKEHVVELTRLWIADITPKNAESFLIGRSLKLLPDDVNIVVSFAEIQAGHVGTVYQATNWIYTGMSDRHVEWSIKGEESNKHGRHMFDEFGGIEGAKKALGERLIRGERPRKHRYLMLRGSRWRKKELLAKLRYEVQEYPKVV